MITRGLGFSTRATLHQLEVSASKLVITRADMLLCNNKYKYLLLLIRTPKQEFHVYLTLRA